MINLNKKTQIILIIIVSLVLIGLVLFFLYSKKNHSSPSNTKTTSSSSTTIEQKTIVQGKVINEQGKPIQDAIIDWSIYSNSEEKNKNNAGQSDKNGFYSIESNVNGQKQIIIYKDHLAAAINFNIIKNTNNNIPDLKLIASDTLEGTCYDKENNKPLSGVNIKIKIPKWSDMEIVKTSDENGKYQFFLIPEDNYTITAQKDLYENTNNQIKITKGEITTSDFILTKTGTNDNSNSNNNSSNSNNSSSNETSSNSNSSSSNTNTSSSSNSSSSSDTNNTTNDSSNSDGTFAVKSESVNLGGYTATVYHPDNSNTYPGILVLNGFSAETLAKYGYYAASIEPESTEAAGSIIDGMKSQELCSDKVGVTGFSWGGAMSMEIGAKTKKTSAVFEMAGLLVPENNINLATDMPCPVYFVTGENDDLAKPADVQAMYDQLRSGGQAGEIYIVPGEGHGYSDSAMSTLYNKALGFFSSYLH